MKRTTLGFPVLAFVCIALNLLYLIKVIAADTTMWVDASPGGNCVGNYSVANRACNGADGNSYSTAAAGLAAFGLLAGGSNILEFRAGTYIQSSAYGNGANAWPLATSWDTANLIRNRAGEAVVVQHLGWVMRESTEGAQISYLRVEGDSRGNFIHEQNGSGGDQSAFNISEGTDHVRIKKTTIRNWTSHGIVGGSCTNKANHIEIIDNLIENNGNNSAGEGHEHGIYPNCSDSWLVEYNHIKTNFAYGVHFYSSTANGHTNATIRYNFIEGRRSTATSFTAYAIIVSHGSGHQIYRNIIKLKSGSGLALVGCIQTGGTQTGTLIYHNTCYGDAGTGVGVSVGSGVTGALIKNNLFDDVNDAIQDNGGAPTVDGNLCPVAATDCHHAGSTNTVETDTPGFVTPGTDFALTAGSAAINACRPITGWAYNGANPDCGAHEGWTFTSGSVTGNIFTLQASMALHTPIVIGVQSGYTVNNGRNVTGIALSGSSAVNETFDGAPCAAESWTSNYNQSPGTATDSALIGGTMSQPAWDVGPVSGINNCAGAVYTITQTVGGFYESLNSQASNTRLFGVSAGGAVAVRMKSKATGGTPPAVVTKIQCAVNGENGAYADVPDTFTAGNCPNLKFVGLGIFDGMDGHSTPIPDERLTSEFTGMIGGSVIRCATGCEVPATAFTNDSETEKVYILVFDLDATGTYHFREVLADNTVLTYAANSRPSITIQPPSASGFASLSDQPSGLTVTPNPMVRQRPSPGWLADAEPSSSLASWSAGSGSRLDGRSTR